MLKIHDCEYLFVEIHVVFLKSVVYLVIGRVYASPTSDPYAQSAEPLYTGQMFQPAASPGAAEHTDAFEEEPPLLEGNPLRCSNVMFLNISCFRIKWGAQ